ncbi:hypothetical protein DV737_g3085, partial [Chaetothyriales sp. CBS 132003]
MCPSLSALSRRSTRWWMGDEEEEAKAERERQRSIVTKAATGTPILSCLSQAIRPALGQPLHFLTSRPFLLIFGLYLSTYSTANTIDTLTSTLSNQPADRVASNTAKFVATSAVNMTVCVYKDSQFARMFGTVATASSPSPAAAIPRLSYALFAARDCLTIFASFNLPTMIAPKLQQLPASVQARFKPLLSTEAGRVNTAQFVAPAAMQIFSTPIHLLGLDLYNRQAKLGVRERGTRVMRDWGVSALARMARIIPAFGVGGVFGAVLYLATIFPATLMPMSVYAVSRGLAAVLFSPLLGRFIDSADRLRVVNSQMRRIDLACKLLGPFLISVFDSVSTLLAIETNFGINVLSVAVDSSARRKRDFSIHHNAKHLKDAVTLSVQGLTFYLRHSAFRPSFAGALLYFTVLSFSGQMITYLLASGLSSLHVTVARTMSVALELSATWLAPFLMARIGPIRSAIWFLNWQLLCLSAGVAVFWSWSAPTPIPVAASVSLVVATIFSRIGLWGFDLSTQVIVQEEVEPPQRGAFSSVEAAFQNAFELLSYACTVSFARPAQFRWPVLISLVAVYTAGAVHSFCPFHSLPTALKLSSPSTKTHHPSPPTVPSSNPPTAFSKFALAYASPASSKLPGCSHTDFTPAALAAFSVSSVVDGGVRKLSPVSAGEGSADTLDTVGQPADCLLSTLRPADGIVLRWNPDDIVLR